MVALAIAVIIRIMALMAAAAIDGVTYHKEIQTAEFVRNWHKHSYELCTEQSRVNSEIVS